jgi:hypothetical protein
LTGISTGVLRHEATDWPELVHIAAEVHGTAAIELAALSEPELEPLLRYLEDADLTRFGFVSVHGPVKRRRMPEPDLIDLLVELPDAVDAIVVHPDLIEDITRYRKLGSRLAVENMDLNKPSGRTAAELAPIFDSLPEARLCLDIAHASAVDPDLDEARELIDLPDVEISHLHISSLSSAGHHVPLTSVDARRFGDALECCAGSPWIYEAWPTT